MGLTDPELYRSYLRMIPSQFEDLLKIVAGDIEKTTYIREVVSTGERLALTLRYLASGESQKNLSYSYRCSPSVICKIILQVLKAIWNNLNNVVFPNLGLFEYKNIAGKFGDMWDFPNCVGAIDGKHVRIQAPRHSGSNFYNYKSFHSIVLVAICDAEYNFTFIDIGGAGQQSDGGIFKNSEFGKKILENRVVLPEPRNLSTNFKDMPFTFIADDAFPLMPNILKPYKGNHLTTEQLVFNYRLSRARRMIENTFGVLTAKWRIYKTPIQANLRTIEMIVAATVCLHNWLRQQQNHSPYIWPELVDRENENMEVIRGEWRKESSTALDNLERNNYNISIKSKLVRDKFSKYFNTDGAVSWQLDKI